MMLSSHRNTTGTLPLSVQQFQQELQNSLIDFHNGLMATQGMLSMNLWNKEGEFLVRIETPGVEVDQIEIKLKGDHVLLNVGAPAGVTNEEEKTSAKWLQKERKQEAWSREFQLPFMIDTQKSSAKFENGILELHLASQPHSEEVILAIQSGTESEDEKE